MTAYTGTNLQAALWQAGYQYSFLGKYTIGATVVTGDTITWSNALPLLTNAVKIIGFRFWGAEFDTHATPTGTVIVGDGTDTDAYLKSKVGGGAAQQLQLFGDGDAIGAAPGTVVGRDVVLTVGGTLATAGTTGDVFVEVLYNCINTNG